MDRFNEAAARGRGKPTHVAGNRPVFTASMRPRREAAENAYPSMTAALPCDRFNEAAARGRGKPVDDTLLPRFIPASMRPRREAAENLDPQGDAPNSVRLASMRPRREAAENRDHRTGQCRKGRRFNEAAARGRGKRLHPGHRQAPAQRFNEAAARGRGKPRSRSLRCTRPSAASMRPRREAAENRPVADPRGVLKAASMRPRREAAENFDAGAATSYTFTLQ